MEIQLIPIYTEYFWNKEQLKWFLMEKKLVVLRLYEWQNVLLKILLKNYNSKTGTMNESDSQRLFKKSTYLRDSKIDSDRWLVNIDNGSQGGTHWTCLIK